jgi:HTH-type transcriptional repressor of NAD biosynthesis genes
VALAGGSPLLVCDTDAFATAVWERRYLGAQARVEPPWSGRPLLPRHDLYLLTDHTDVAWEPDGLREGDLDVRTSMTIWFEDALVAAGHSWFPLSGGRTERLEIAVEAVNTLLVNRLTFAPPLRGPGFEPTA